jgi:hypothetical protein
MALSTIEESPASKAAVNVDTSAGDLSSIAQSPMRLDFSLAGNLSNIKDSSSINSPPRNRGSSATASNESGSSMDISSFDQSPPRQNLGQDANTSDSNIVGASHTSPVGNRRHFDESTAGSVSDSTASSSDYTAGSGSYLTVGSISPKKGTTAPTPVVPAAATATPTPTPTPTPATASAPVAVDTSVEASSSKMSIK